MPTSEDYIPNEHEPRQSRGRRWTDEHPHRSVPNWQVISFGFVMLVQFSGMVWGAATMASALTQVQVYVNQLQGQSTNLSAQTVDLSGRVRVVESKVDDLRDKLRDK